MDKPAVRCFVAEIVSEGCWKRPELVSLEEAYLRHVAGTHAIVGPDPSDQEALATWEREQTARINKPRWWQE